MCEREVERERESEGERCTHTWYRHTRAPVHGHNHGRFGHKTQVTASTSIKRGSRQQVGQDDAGVDVLQPAHDLVAVPQNGVEGVHLVVLSFLHEGVLDGYTQRCGVPVQSEGG